MLRNLTIACALVVSATPGVQASAVLSEPHPDSAWTRRILRQPDPDHAAERAGRAKAMAAGEADARAGEILEEHALRLFGPDRSVHPRLRQERSRRSLSGHQIRYRQTVRGVPVENGLVMVAMDHDGRMLSVFNDARPNLRLDDPSPAFPSGEAIQIALSRLSGELVHHSPPRAELVLLPQDDGILAYKIQAPMYRPYIDLLAFVDAKSGEILRFEDAAIHESPVPEGFGMDAPPPASPARVSNKGASTGTGLVLPANPLNGHPERYHLRDADRAGGIIDSYRERVSIERLDGSGLLRGQYADVLNQDQPRANEPTLTYDYSTIPADGPFQEVNTYWHVDTYQNYLSQTLGIVGAKDVVQELVVHGQEGDQSSYFTGSGHIDLGDGGVDDSEDGEIVIHEYGHALHDYISGIDRNTHENMALSEGFGDYIAASFGENACVGEWDATSYNPGPPPCLRRTDSGKVYPGDMINQVHADGEIISSAWWEMNQNLGAETADRLIIESFFLLPFSGRFVDFADATILVDRALNGGANESVIRTAYVNHGIIPTTAGTLIAHRGLEDQIEPGPYRIEVTVNSDSALRSNEPVILYHRLAGDGSFAPVSMTPSQADPGLFDATIPDPGSPASFEYYIMVHLESGTAVRSPASGQYSFSSNWLPTLELEQNVPNPFNPDTSIAFSLPVSGRASLRIYDVAGRMVRELFDAPMAAGAGEPVIWNGRDDAGRGVSSGVYFYVLEQSGTRTMRKMVMLR